MNQLPDWMYHAIEESFTCQFASITAHDIPVALPVFLHHFDPDTGILIITSPARMKRVENVRRRPRVAILFSPAGTGPEEPKYVLLVQGLAEVDDTNLASGWKRYFAGWARRQHDARASLARMEQVMPGYTQRAIIRVRPTRFLGWPGGDFQPFVETRNIGLTHQLFISNRPEVAQGRGTQKQRTNQSGINKEHMLRERGSGNRILVLIIIEKYINNLSGTDGRQMISMTPSVTGRQHRPVRHQHTWPFS